MEVYVECPRENLTLRGMLHVPSGADADHKVPMVLIFHGFTADRNESLFVHTALSRALCDAGIASLRFDFAGSGESDGDFSNMSVFTEVKDAETILNYAEKLDFVDLDKIALHGMSQGGVVASLLAACHNDEIRTLSLWAPAIALFDCVNANNLLGIDVSNIEDTGIVDNHGIALGKIYCTDARDFDYYGAVKDYTGHVQIIHGTADTTVPIEYSRRLAEELGDQAALIEVEGAGHDFGSLEYRKTRIDDTVDYLKKELLG